MYIAPSVLAADYTQLSQEMERVKSADFLHLDIMDGHFVPNISFGPDFVGALKGVSALPFDVHLMVNHPLAYVERFAEAGADILCFHIESQDDPQVVIGKIQSLGRKPALSLKPGTPVERLYPFAKDVYMVLVMTVEPGFGGQAMQQEQLLKVQKLKERFPHLLIEVDGGVNRDNICICAAAGVDIAVAGTSIFRAECPTAEIALLKQLAAMAP